MFTKNIFLSKKFYKSIGILLVIHFFCFFFILLTKQANAGEKLILSNGEITIQELKTMTRSNAVAKSSQIGANQAANKLDLPTVAKSIGARSRNYVVVQFKEKIQPNDELALKELQLEVLRYIPEDSLVVSGESSQILKLQQLENLQGIVPYASLMQKNSGVRLQSVFDRGRLKKIDIQLFKNANAEEIANQITAMGGTVLDLSGHALVVEVFGDQIENLNEMPGIEWIADHAVFELLSLPLSNVESNESVAVARDLTGYESGTRLMNFEKAWAQGLNGEGEVVAVSDSGLDKGDQNSLSADFSNFYQGVAYGYASNTWADYIGHGTHVSGSILGSGALSGGINKGGANKARLMVQSIWSQKQQTVTLPADLRTLFANSYSSGARVHSNSWGDVNANGRYDRAAAQVDDFVWEHPDMVILFASGNNGVDRNRDGRVDGRTINSPGTAKNVITVGASENQVLSGGIQTPIGKLLIDQGKSPWPVPPLSNDRLSDNPRGLAAFSSRGPAQDGRIKPDVVAPGTNILSNCSRMEGSSAGWGQLDSNYCYNGGTSMATPLAAGAATVIRQYLLKSVANPSAALIKGLMIHSAVDLFPGQFGEVGEANGQEILKRAPNSEEGYGLIDVGAATYNPYQIVDDKVGVGSTEVKVFNFNEPIRKVTLVYSDAPASPTAGPALVNNLDLKVEIAGQVLKSVSRIDNIEQIIIPSGSPQTSVKVLVSGENVPMGKNGKQPFALVIN